MLQELQAYFSRTAQEAATIEYPITKPQEGDLPEVLLAKMLALLNPMRSNAQVSGIILDEAALPRMVRNSGPKNIVASTATGEIVAAVAGQRIRVLSVIALAGGTETDLTFKSASTAISLLFANASNGGEVLPHNAHGWFQTAPGEALNVTTGAGSTTGIQVNYLLIPNYLTDENGIVVTDEAGNPLLVS